MIREHSNTEANYIFSTNKKVVKKQKVSLRIKPDCNSTRNHLFFFLVIMLKESLVLTQKQLVLNVEADNTTKHIEFISKQHTYKLK